MEAQPKTASSALEDFKKSACYDLAFEAFTEALCHIQKKLGVTDGGLASHFWSYDREEAIIDQLKDYVSFEIQNMEE